MKNIEGALTRLINISSVIEVNKNLIEDIKIEGYKELLNPVVKGKIAQCDPSKFLSSFEQKT